jgi:hypothetical protein
MACHVVRLLLQVFGERTAGASLVRDPCICTCSAVDSGSQMRLAFGAQVATVLAGM